jgi:hypothetical protein
MVAVGNGRGVSVTAGGVGLTDGRASVILGVRDGWNVGVGGIKSGVWTAGEATIGAGVGAQAVSRTAYRRILKPLMDFMVMVWWCNAESASLWVWANDTRAEYVWVYELEGK